MARTPRIYIASSWRNIYQPRVCDVAREHGFEVYDFRNPEPGNSGFRWSEIDGGWKSWTFEEYREALRHPVAQRGFDLDMNALRSADACLLVMPSGRSAALELGWACGQGLPAAVLYPTDLKHPTTEEALHLFGHHLINYDPCPGCGYVQPGCLLPGKLARDFEPELMVKMAVPGGVLIGLTELRQWLENTHRFVSEVDDLAGKVRVDRV